MVREFSAGGVVVRRMQGKWWVAVIEPQRESGTSNDKKSHRGRNSPVLALPKGIVDRGEQPERTALREVREEAGIDASSVAKLTDIKYFYVRTWSDKQRVFKIVSFYLLFYRSGRIGDIAGNMRHEVRRAFWIPIEQAAEQLTYKGEREAVALAMSYLAAHPELGDR
jgi:8-oxo-dGTP pyrophosphatase MutT (NUDIX family)